MHEAYHFYYRRDELQALRSGQWKLHFPHTCRTMIGRMPGKHGMPDKYDYSAPIGLARYDLENDISELNDLSEK